MSFSKVEEKFDGTDHYTDFKVDLELLAEKAYVVEYGAVITDDNGQDWDICDYLETINWKESDEIHY